MALRFKRRGIAVNEQLLAACFVWALIVTSKVFSPQYLLWLSVVLAVLAPTQFYDKALGGALVLASVITHAIFPWLYVSLIHEAWPALLLVTLRDALVIYIGVRLVGWLFTQVPNDPVAQTSHTPPTASAALSA